MMSQRLADYFVVVGYNHERNDIHQGKILQRFPEKDWLDVPWIEGIELFCQPPPPGWMLSMAQEEPKFFMSVLTNVDGNHYYCAVLSFSEKLSITPSKPVDEEEENLPLGNKSIIQTTKITHLNIMYAPKCLVLVSRLDYPETFKNCLGTIYTVYLENLQNLETLVGNILGCIQIPPAGGPQVRFSIGAGDKQALQPPLSATLPATSSSVFLLFKQLGMKNVLLLYCAAMTEHKILFHSSSYSRLTESCRALTALMYPLRYSHTYVPILPAAILEILSTPTPFIMGIHSSLQNEINDVLDVIVADLDGGSIHIPDSLITPVSKLPQNLWEFVNYSLTIILQPELAEADNAFPKYSRENNESRDQNFVDKEIRAIFMRAFAQLLQGYRSCLTLIRINPKPVIEFHKAAFLGSRDLSESDFLAKVLDSMFFTMFVTERGPPWRRYDAFDELYSAMPELMKSENNDRRLVHVHIQELAQKLFINEIPSSQVYQQKIPRPPEGALSRIHQPEFPVINAQQVQKIISDGMAKNDLQSRFQLKNNLKIIPLGPHLPSFNEGRPILSHTVRKMEVIQNCVNFVFENKIAEARKIFPAVLRILKQRDEARLFLCEELAKVVQNSNKVLEHPQFDLVIKLMNRALQDNSQNNLHDIAASLLPLSAAFCRKLCPGVIQFAYSCIQGHGIWKNQSFWEQAFYQEIQANIKNLYVNRPIERNNFLSGTTPSVMSSPYDIRVLQEQSALEIAAEQMMKWPSMDTDRQQNFVKTEEQIVYSQAVHYANRMIFLQIPMDVRSNVKVKKIVRHDEDDASISNSVLESRSDQSTDIFEVRDANEVEQTVIRQVEKFIDKVCNEGGVSPENIKKLHEIIPSMVDMHCETLDIVFRESKRIPPVQKPKIQSPNVLSGEEIICGPIRATLLPDGREETISPLLPAEGAIFLTNYRCIFKGLPCDSLTCEQTVIRAFPVASLTKEKRTSGILSNDHVFADGLQLRSSTFQLMKLGFDEDVSQETIEHFRKVLNRVRHPEDESGHFAFSNYSVMKPTNPKSKEKYATLKGFAKKTLLKTTRKAGFKQKNNTKRKYNFSTPHDVETFYGGSMGGMSNNLNTLNNDNSDDDDNSDDIGNTEPTSSRFTVKDVERLKERSYVKDLQRLGLLGNGFKLSTVNCNYGLCRTYPALIVSPRMISDEQLKSLAKTFKNQRIPAATWRHKNGSVLLRGSVSLAKGVMGMLKTGAAHTSSESKSDMMIQDQFFCAIIPQQHQQNYHHNMKVKNSESSISIDSLLGGSRSPMSSTFTSTLSRKDRFLKPGKWGDSLKRNNEGLRDVANNFDDSHLTLQRTRVPLYILGERSLSKSVRLAELGAEYIPVYYNDSRHLREAFKKLMRACLPSTISNEPDSTFFKLIENSEWLQQIRSLMQLSGTIVDLIEIHEASVQIALEDGWDISCQVSALAQLCLDPYYRTFEGFRTLIEKEWLAFGHRFGHRSNLKPNSSSFVPVFLQFLDAVHQILTQYPMSFEFNDYYLKFLAYHSVSCRFRTFLFDCELERFEFGITAVEDKRGSLNSHKHQVETSTNSDDETIYPGGLRHSANSNQSKLGSCIFDYIERQHVKSPIFYNFKYTGNQNYHILRPQSSTTVLEVWDFYINEDLCNGPAYDLELIGNEGIEDESECPKFPKRRFISMGYDNIARSDPDAFTILLDELKQTESERSILPQKWKQVWDNRIEIPRSDSLNRQSSFSSGLVKSHGRYIHNITTIDVLRRGLAGYQECFSHPHRFEKHVYTTPVNCSLCDSMILWGPVRNGVRCIDCGNSFHEKCSENAPKNCTKYKAVESHQHLLSGLNLNDKQDTCSITSNNTNEIYRGFESNLPENRTHEGYLYKRGALLKSWKQRWFVLDSIKHQLRYYDSVEDSTYKGAIDLADVTSVGHAYPVQMQGTKRIDEKAFFDLRTAKRNYNFYASDATSANEWIEKIQACLQ